MNSVYDNDDYCDFVTNAPNIHTQCITLGQTDNTHAKELSSKSQIKMKQPNIAKNAYEKLGPFGLFKLFYSDTIRDAMWEWTNNHFARTGTHKISKFDLDVFIALEMAMGLRKNNSIKDYWSKKEFLGDASFPKYQSRRNHLRIRSNMQTHSPTDSDNDVIKSEDPLWHSQSILQNINRACIHRGSFLGCGAHDEISLEEKGRTSAKTYMPIKPIKYGLRFYGLASSAAGIPPYLFSFINNGSGNTSNKSLPENYVDQYPKLRRPYEKILKPSKLVDPKSPSALWALQKVHLAQSFPEEEKHIFSDNFYTSHKLSKLVLTTTDGKLKITGTCRFNKIDATNRTYVRKGLEMLDKMDRGSWILVRAYDMVEDLDKMRRKFNEIESKKTEKQRKNSSPPHH